MGKGECGSSGCCSSKEEGEKTLCCGGEKGEPKHGDALLPSAAAAAAEDTLLQSSCCASSSCCDKEAEKNGDCPVVKEENNVSCCSSKSCGNSKEATGTIASTHHHAHQQHGHGHGHGHAHGHGHGHEHAHQHQHAKPHEHATQHQHAHEHHKQEEHHDAGSLCLAVVREDGTDVVLFDASGVPRTFSYKGDTRKLCFSTHNTAFDDWLTPCFDEDGLHGVPEESCFCGVDTPHLHAHLKDPKTCNGSSSSGSKSKRQEEDIGYLAAQTLHPVESQEDYTESDGLETPLLRIDVSERMPNQCNSRELQKRLSDQEIGSSEGNRFPLRRRLHKIKHDDHIDYLVHNETTGDLHLEHPCDDCGDNDVHGTFFKVGRRKLGDNGVQIHFFEIAQRPFSLFDYLQDVFEIKSDRVAAVDNILSSTAAATKKSQGCCGTTTASCCATPASKTCNFEPRDEVAPPPLDSTLVRSTLTCSGICCSAECPLIEKIVRPLKGVERVMINVPLKQVNVDHDPALITAKSIAAALSDMGGVVKRDGATATGGSSNKEVGKSQFFVQGICCPREIPAINRIVEPLDGVVAVSINTTTKTVYVEHKVSIVSALAIAQALSDQGFGAEVRHDAGESIKSAGQVFVRSTLSFAQTEADTDELASFMQTFDSSQMESFIVDVPNRTIAVVHNAFTLSAQSVADGLQEHAGIDAKVSHDGADPKNWVAPSLAEEGADHLCEDESFTYPRPTVILSGVFWIISMFSLIGGNWDYLKYVALIGIAFGIPPIMMKAFKTLRRYQFDTNCLMFFAAVGAVALQEFAEAAAVVFLFALSEWLEVRATSRARRALSAIVQLRPDRANLIHPSTKELIVIPAAAVPVGALVSVKTGDKVPCDGVVVDGTSTVDESSLTGESRPIQKGPNDKLAGGTVNSGMSPLTVRTTATAENSAVSRLIRLVEEAQANRSETEKLVDDFARVYTPVVVLAALMMCTIPWAFGKDTGEKWAHNGLILIVVACPCALIISTPVSYVAGLAATAQKGVLIKGGATLEALGMVKHVCFDKTGTLTNGEFALLDLKVVGDALSRVEVLQYLSLMEEKASHPVAQAILMAAQREKVVIPKNMHLQRHSINAGEGVGGTINDKTVHVGNERLFARLGLLETVPAAILRDVDEWKGLGGTVGFMSVDGHGIVCAYYASDGIREESARVVGNLKRAGIKVTMLTGDNADAAEAIGAQAGLSRDEIKAKLLPEEKLSYIESLSGGQTNRSVLFSLCEGRELTLMCGDGVNDAPALAAANVSVAMGAGAALAMDTADATLLDSNLEKLEYSMRMGRRVIAKIKQNVIFSVAVKFAVLGLAIAGTTHLWTAIASDVGSMLLVTLNAMSLLPRRQRSADVQVLKGDIEATQTVTTGLSRGETASTHV